ncbi:MAG TPA: hypothetical protein ENN42_08455 [Thioalkalivibrio sp.]|nr:hypothetical protein [Thioalkalivibrio sp.]
MQDPENDAVRVALGQAVISALDARDVERATQRALIARSHDEWKRAQKGAPLPLQFELELLERGEPLPALPARHDARWWSASADGLLTDGLAAMEAAAQHES